MTETPEHESLERLVDAARTAADRVQEMCRAHAADAPVMPLTLIQLRRNLSAAKGSAHQLGHQQQNPHFFAVRDQLGEIESGITRVAMSRSPAAGLILAGLGAALDALWREAQRMATARPVARQDVLAALDMRQKAVAGNG